MIATLILARWVQLISIKKFLTFLLIGVGLCIIVSPSVYKYIMTRPEATLARIDLNKVGLEMIKAHPIIGVGLNNHLVEKPKYDPNDYLIPMPTHNRYLLIASEIGIPGLLFFLGFLWLTFITALQAARTKDRYLASVALGIVGAFFATMLHYLVDHLTFHTTLTLIWLYAGLSAALSRWTVMPLEKDFPR
jgi:O-antigen ligase